MNSKNLIIVVNFNQSEEIENFLGEVLKYFPKAEVVVVDDGSTDGSEKISVRMGFETLVHSKNLGIGAAIRTGLQYALDRGFEGILISSSNGKMVPAEFRSLLNILDGGEFNYVQGSRFLRGGRSEKLPPFRRLMIPVVSFLISHYLGKQTSDITCGLRAYKTKLLRDPRINMNQDWLNRYEFEYYLHIKFIKVLRVPTIEVPVTIKYGHLKTHRRSKIKPITGWWSMARPFVFLLLRIKT